MSELKLIYTSEAINAKLLNERLYDSGVEFDDIKVFEYYNPDANQYGEYKIQIEANAKSSKELREKNKRAERICRIINQYSPFIFYHPLGVRTKDSFGKSKLLRDIGNIEGWESNFRDLQFEFQKLENPDQKTFVTVKPIPNLIPWVVLPESPLMDIYNFIEKHDRVSEMTKKLAYFHSNSKQNELDIRYLILGKALEIAREFLPAHPKNALKKLPSEIKEYFEKYDKDVKWLYDISNNRLETRHALEKGKGNLHPVMDGEELEKFAHLSDLLITYLVRQKFGLKVVTWNS